MLCQSILYFIYLFLPYMPFVYILCCLVLCFYGCPVYVNMCVSTSVCVSCALSLATFLLFVLSYYSLFLFCIFILLLFQMLVSFLMRMKKKGCGFGREERWGGYGRNWKRGNYSQDILCGGKTSFSVREKNEVLWRGAMLQVQRLITLSWLSSGPPEQLCFVSLCQY